MQICKEHTTDLTADRQKVKYIHTYVFMYVGTFVCVIHMHLIIMKVNCNWYWSEPNWFTWKVL